MGIEQSSGYRTFCPSALGPLRVSLPALMIALASPVLAQDSVRSSAPGALEEIVVTAQFREQNLQDTPISISALSGDMIEARGYTTITELTESVPNVTMTEAASGFGRTNQIFIRGIGQEDSSNAFSPRVAVYVDDVNYSSAFGSVFDLLDLERIEILRGPQGTLFGRNAVGGAVRIFSRKPRGDGSGSIELTGGSNDRYEVKASLDLPVVGETLALRLSGAARKRDGYVDLYNFKCLYPDLAGSLPGIGVPSEKGCKVGTLGGGERYNARLALRWRPGSGIDNTLFVDYMDDKAEPPAEVLRSISLTNPATGAASGLGLWTGRIGQPVYGVTLDAATLAALLPAERYRSYAIFGNPRADFANPAVNSARGWAVSNNLDWDAAPWLHVKSITSYQTVFSPFGANMSAIALPTQQFYSETDHEQFSQEFQFRGNLFANKLEWTTGLFYFKSDQLKQSRTNSEGNTIIADNYSNDPSSHKSKGAFAHAIFHVTDRLNLTAGVRYSEEDKTYSFGRFYIEGSNVGRDFVQDTRSSVSRVNPRFAIDYQFTDDVLLYASYATAYTSGGFNPRPFDAKTVLPVGPEDIASYEIGLKSELFDRRLRFNLAGYFTKFDDIQVTLNGRALYNVPFYVANGGDAEIKGFEAEIEGRPVPDWLISASLGMVDFQYVRLAAGISGGLTLDSHPMRTPKWKASFGTQYSIDLGDAGTITPRIDAVYQTRVYSTEANDNPFTYQNGYMLANARITWSLADPAWDVVLSVTNLTNKLYYVDLVDQRDTFGTAKGQIGRPREWAISLRRSF